MRDETHFERRELGATALVAVHGDVDILNADEFETAVRQAGPSVAVDLSDCSYFDSSAIAALIRAYKALGRRDFGVVIPADSYLRRVFTIAGITSVFTLFERVEALPAGA